MTDATLPAAPPASDNQRRAEAAYLAQQNREMWQRRLLPICAMRCAARVWIAFTSTRSIVPN